MFIDFSHAFVIRVIYPISIQIFTVRWTIVRLAAIFLPIIK